MSHCLDASRGCVLQPWGQLKHCGCDCVVCGMDGLTHVLRDHTNKDVMKDKDWIGVDLDRTLAIRNSGDPITRVGEPIHEMVNRVKQWVRDHKTVKILTARVNPIKHPDDHVQQGLMIERWCDQHIGVRLEVTSAKDSKMIELWDDLAVRVEENTGRQLSPAKHGSDVFMHNAFLSLTNEQRLLLIKSCCHGCGAVNNSCNCSGDCEVIA